MTTIDIQYLDEVFAKVNCDLGVARELTEKFKFQVPGYQFTPRYKSGFWDGYIYLFSPKTRKIYRGLLNYVKAYCDENGYEYRIPPGKSNEFTLEDVRQYIAWIRIPERFEIRDYQLDSILDCVNNQRRLTVSPTGSGKSLIIYVLSRFHSSCGKVLIIVPNVGLVNQMTNDFYDYGYDINNVHRIYSGQEKDSDYPITISTWQSIYKMPKEWFNQFSTVIGDEAHKAKAANLKAILEKMTNTPYRYGFTGSLDGTLTHKMVLEGLFGPYVKHVSTAELIDKKVLSDLLIRVMLIKHDEETSKDVALNKDYHHELATLVANEKRNDLIAKIASSLEGNVLVLYQFVEKHGAILYDKIKNLSVDHDKPVYFIHGKIESTEREDVRLDVNKRKYSVTVASMGCFAEGINIPNLDYIVLASPTKSRIRVMQMIGRGLRRTDSKNECVVIDLADDLSYRKRQNFTLKHYAERLKYYNEENFRYTQHRIEL